jgi:hypothetical protein
VDPAPLAPNVACVDYSVAKGGRLAAYRWDGEHALRADRFVTVPAKPSADEVRADSDSIRA